MTFDDMMDSLNATPAEREQLLIYLIVLRSTALWRSIRG